MSVNSMIKIENVTRRFGDFVAVDDISLEIREGEFFALLGPSGCGKTTLLRMLAGLDSPSAGRILIDGRDMTQVPPNKRPVNMVFQSYAVFPHMSVEANVEYGLKIAGIPRSERVARVREALALVKLDSFGARKPDELSGGQRQRVALARALVNRPKVLLLDEPLSALDAKLRDAMRFELTRIQQAVGITFVMVTHDQDEALAMASRCAILNHGALQQLAEPPELYERPHNRFVADFIGTINLFKGVLASKAPGNVAIDIPALGSQVVVDRDVPAANGSTVWAGIRPEKVAMSPASAGQAIAPSNCVIGTVQQMAYLGCETVYEVALDGGSTMKVSRPNTQRREDAVFVAGSRVHLEWEPGSPLVVLS